MDLRDAPPVTPTLEDGLDARIRQAALDLQVCCPAHVVSYAGGLATVQLGRLPVRLGSELPEPPIVIPGCPVAWPGGTAASDTWPLAAGAIGLAIFADRALDRWLELLAPCDPVAGTAHSLAHAIFLPLAVGVPAVEVAGSRVIEAPQIQLGATATQYAAIATLVHQYLVGMITAAPTNPVPDGGATFKAGLLAYLGANPAASMGGTKVKVE